MNIKMFSRGFVVSLTAVGCIAVSSVVWAGPGGKMNFAKTSDKPETSVAAQVEAPAVAEKAASVEPAAAEVPAVSEKAADVPSASEGMPMTVTIPARAEVPAVPVVPAVESSAPPAPAPVVPAAVKNKFEAVMESAPAKVEAAVEKSEPIIEKTKPVAPPAPEPVKKKVKAPPKPVKAVDPAQEAGVQQELMAKWKANAAPGDRIKALETLAGSWNYTLRVWRSPDSEPEVSTGTSEVTLAEGGAFLEQSLNGTSLGQAFQGRSVTAFDQVNNTYVGYRFDDLGIGTVAAQSGRYDADAGMFIQNGTGKDGEFRWVTRIKDKNNYVFQSFMPDAERGEYLGWDIAFTRKVPIIEKVKP